ncbi:hypothetical protein [Bifidobacterium miconisargentati]|uniref:hypothetical protein n=1 Tax=Bifidobacterium miconisargentati TaxID=2834437 RepID=UPI001BDBC56D|nr:hypothetical protein [Bifidobacterium miconisargentati]MBW3089245.1 hypothetical protein [Bifidobacterium miconisargentati]
MTRRRKHQQPDDKAQAETAEMIKKLDAIDNTQREILASLQKRKPLIADIVPTIIDIIACVGTIGGLIFAGVQIDQSTDQFLQSGPAYSLKVLGMQVSVNDMTANGVAALQTAGIGVLSNSGRLQGSITAFDQEITGGNRTCIPTMKTSHGKQSISTDPKDVRLLNQGQITLNPGESILILFVTPEGTGKTTGYLPKPGKYSAFTPGWDQVDIDVSDPQDPKSNEDMIKHYQDMPGFGQAVANCRSLAE